MIEANVVNSLDMSIYFERGPQKEESRLFNLSSKIKQTEIESTFKRVSGFYFDKTANKWYNKECRFLLGYYHKKEWREISAVTVQL